MTNEIMMDPKVAAMPPQEGAKLIAKQVREALNGYATLDGTRETLNANPAPSVNGNGTLQKKATDNKPVSFFDQVKLARSKKRA